MGVFPSLTMSLSIIRQGSIALISIGIFWSILSEPPDSDAPTLHSACDG